MSTLVDILEDLQSISDILFVIRSDGAVAEIRSGLVVSHKKDWITIGHNDGPAHMHIRVDKVSTVRFVQEEKGQRTSYSVQFLNKDNERIIAAFFTKMYNQDMNPKKDRLNLYYDLENKWSNKI